MCLVKQGIRYIVAAHDDSIIHARFISRLYFSIENMDLGDHRQACCHSTGAPQVYERHQVNTGRRACSVGMSAVSYDWPNLTCARRAACPRFHGDLKGKRGEFSLRWQLLMDSEIIVAVVDGLVNGLTSKEVQLGLTDAI